MRRLAAILAFIPAGFGASTLRADVATREWEFDGARLRVELHAPSRSSADAVVLAHGFLREPANLAGYARAIAADGRLALVPGMPSRVDSRANGRALSALVARLREGAFGHRVDRVVLVGFSAGGLSALLAAGSPGVAGYIGLDAFDRPSGTGLEAARALAVPVVLLHGAPAFCNAYNISAPWRAAVPRLEKDLRVEGAGHCDFEWPTDAGCTLACGAVHPAAQAVIRAEVRAALERLLPR